MADETAKKVHWTQTPEGRERMRAIQQSSAMKQRINRAKKRNAAKKKKKEKRGGIFQYLTPAQQKAHLKKMAAGRKRQQASDSKRAAKTRAVPPASVNGDETPVMVHRGTKVLMRASINALAVEGAQMKLARLRRECEMLEIFIRGVR